jgi:radical SAM protein
MSQAIESEGEPPFVHTMFTRLRKRQWLNNGMVSSASLDPLYDRAPRIVIWEMTRACALACRHCRAEAQPRRDPLELGTAEAFTLIDQVAGFGKPLFVLTGGDPMMRDDLYELVEYGCAHGLPVSISPSATGRLTDEAIGRLAAAGVRRMALSLDAPDAAEHDAFRGVRGSYARTLRAVRVARERGMSVQINTTLSQVNVHSIDEFGELLAGLDVAMWSVFFVLPIGRATADLCLCAHETEGAFARLAAVAEGAGFDVKTTEAPHYRRYLMQHAASAPPRERPAGAGAPPLRFAGIGDGRGFVFVSHQGDVYPSGFLPLRVGNVRERSLVEIYRDAPVMRRLRCPETFGGKCGLCEFHRICGGSRARAYLTSGDPFASDPSCAYVSTAAGSLADV